MNLQTTNQSDAQLSEPKYPVYEEQEALKVAEEARQYKLFNKLHVPFSDPVSPKFTFIDLFAGIGIVDSSMQPILIYKF